MMRKLAVYLALASTVIATPALARDKSWYVGVDGGGTIVENISYDIGTTRNAANASHDYGFDVSGNVGYDFGVFRVEAEVGYRRAHVRNYSSQLTTPAFTATGAVVDVPSGFYRGVGGSESALSFMANALIDFGDEDGVQGFFGGGVGIARVKAQDLALNQSGPFLDDSDTRFAYQGLAGVRAPLTRNIDVSVKYRFFTAPDARYVDVRGRNFSGQFRSHSLLGGITYNFGAPAAPPPPPPPPPPGTELGFAGTMRSGSTLYALLSQGMVREGAQDGRYTVEKISQDRITLGFDGQHVTLSVAASGDISTITTAPAEDR